MKKRGRDAKLVSYSHHTNVYTINTKRRFNPEKSPRKWLLFKQIRQQYRNNATSMALKSCNAQITAIFVKNKWWILAQFTVIWVNICGSNRNICGWKACIWAQQNLVSSRKTFEVFWINYDLGLWSTFVWNHFDSVDYISMKVCEF